ncbi:MAG: hypothetical protein ACAH89_03435 [Rariglobus sp.]|nr:hypothetical protein [Rariglobus sp.]
MLSFLKKPSDKSSASAAPMWHPNFRNFERLPDTKVVRTTFFINGVAILVATTLAIYVTYREVELNTLKADTDAAQQVIDANKPGSDQSVALFKKFQEQEKKIQELDQFLAISKITLSDFILQLGSTLPPSVILSSIDYRPAGVILRGRIKGSSEEGAGKADAYVNDLTKNSYFSELFDSIKLTNIVRDPASGEIVIQIDLRFRAQIKPTSGGKK